MVLCHDEDRLTMKGYEHEGLAVRSLEDCIAIYEDAASWRRPHGARRAPVVAIALNTSRLDGAGARARIADAARRTGLPAADPIREGATGADRIARAVLESASARVT
jgi:uncharacterized NAD-dependent epimerase/dehydratase family protein